VSRLTERRGSTNSEAMCPALPKLAPAIPGAARSSSNTGSAFADARVSRGRADHASTHHCHGVVAHHPSATG
jgi:hypothetical protein